MPLAEFSLENVSGPAVVVEVDEPPEGFVRVARAANGLLIATKSFEDAIAALAPITRSVYETLSAVRPQELEIEMGFKLTAESGVVVAKAGGEAHIMVKLVWKADSGKR
jgi:hypothetical protein